MLFLIPTQFETSLSAFDQTIAGFSPPFVTQCGVMTSLFTQIVVDDDEIMEYELNPQATKEPVATHRKRHHFLIHNTLRPSPSTFTIGTVQPSLVKPVGVEDSVFAPESSLGLGG